MVVFVPPGVTEPPGLTVLVLQGQWTQEPGLDWAHRQSLVSTALTPLTPLTPFPME